jgi:hypothetical protein
MLLRILLSCIALWLITAPGLQAQTTLRWKLTAGEKLAVAVTQNTTSEVTYSGKTTKTKIDLAMDLTWRVIAVENEKIRLEQSISRLSVSFDAPPAGRVQYDSAEQEKLTGPAKEIAASLQPLLAAKVEITMNDRGEILEAKEIKNAAASAGPTAAASLISPEAVQQLLKQPLVVLPEKPVSTGDTWTTKNDLQSALGPAQQTTTFRYAGPAEVEAKKVELIEVTTTLKLTPPATAKITLKEHTQTGTVRFDAAAGRVVSAEQKQKLVTERPYRETTIVVTLGSEQTTTVQPPAAAP